MANQEKDLVIPQGLLTKFSNAVRIIDKKNIVGIKPLNPELLTKMESSFPEFFNDKRFQSNFEVALTYKGRNIKGDMEKAGIKLDQSRISKDIFIRGIPVPDKFLKDLALNPAKFGIIFAQK